MPPERHKTIVKHVCAAWGDATRVIEMKAKGAKHMQAIAELAEFPAQGWVSLTTIGLSDHGGIELATVAPVRYKSAIKALFDVASYVAAGHRKLGSDEIFAKVLSRFYTKNDVGHWTAWPPTCPQEPKAHLFGKLHLWSRNWVTGRRSPPRNRRHRRRRPRRCRGNRRSTRQESSSSGRTE